MKFYCFVKGEKTLKNLNVSKLYSNNFYSGKDTRGYFIFWKAPKGKKNKKIYVKANSVELDNNVIPSHWYLIFKG